MRLSSRLSDKSKNTGEIESFIDWEKYTISPEEETEEVHLISAGDFLEIQIGTILLPFYSTACEDSVTFVSPQELHCLIINKQMISMMLSSPSLSVLPLMKRLSILSEQPMRVASSACETLCDFIKSCKRSRIAPGR